MPVLFYIHGGAWVHGSSKYVGEKYFMDEDVILVSVNYRLGALGRIFKIRKTFVGDVLWEML